MVDMTEDFNTFSVGETYEAPTSESDIVNNPYSLGTNEGITADPSLFENSDYYPSKDDEVIKGKVIFSI